MSRRPYGYRYRGRHGAHGGELPSRRGLTGQPRLHLLDGVVPQRETGRQMITHPEDRVHRATGRELA